MVELDNWKYVRSGNSLFQIGDVTRTTTWWSKGPSFDFTGLTSSNKATWDDSLGIASFLGPNDRWWGETMHNIRCLDVETEDEVAPPSDAWSNTWLQGSVYTLVGDVKKLNPKIGLTEFTRSVITSEGWQRDTNMWYPGLVEVRNTLGTMGQLHVSHASECLHNLIGDNIAHHIAWNQPANPLYMYFHNTRILQPKRYIETVDESSYPEKKSVNGYNIYSSDSTYFNRNNDRFGLGRKQPLSIQIMQG